MRNQKGFTPHPTHCSSKLGSTLCSQSKISQYRGRKAMGAGFTFPELIVVIGIFAILFGLTTANLPSFQRLASVSSTVDTLVSDIKSQQIKAMVGATEGRVAADNYGIRFEQNKYIFFHGTSYNSNDSSNFTVNLDQNMQFQNITFPNAVVIFSQGLGEVVGYASGSSSLTIKNTAGSEQKTITVNRYGVIVSVQ